MHLRTMSNEATNAMIVVPPSLDQANIFSMCFAKEFTDYYLLIDPGDGTDDVTLYDAYEDDKDMVGIGRILDVASHEPHSAFDLFEVFVHESDGVTLYDACTDKMDMMCMSVILDVALRELFFALDLFEVSMLELDNDGSIPDLVAFDFTSIEGERPTMLTHIFLLTLCPSLSPTMIICLLNTIMI